MIGAGGVVLLAGLAVQAPGADDGAVLALDGGDDETRLAQGVLLDRLIREKRTVRPELLVRLFPAFRDETTILLVSHPARPVDAWLQLLGRSNVADNHWLAFANALLQARAPAFARYLLGALPTKLEIRVSPPGTTGGRSSGTTLGLPSSTRGPRRPCYQLASDPRPEAGGWVVFSSGPRPVAYRRDEKEGATVNCGRCLAAPAGDSARRHLGQYLARLAGLPVFELDPLFDDAVSAPAEEPPQRIEARARAGRARAFQQAAGKLVQVGLLDRAPPVPDAEITLIDQRGAGPGRGAAAPAPGVTPAAADPARSWWRIVGRRDGRPVPQARSYFQESPFRSRASDPAAEPSVQAVSDRDGFLALEVPPGVELVRVEADGRAPAVFTALSGRAERARAVSIPLPEGARVPVEARDRAGSPVAGVTIQVSGYVAPVDGDDGIGADLRWSCQTNRAGACRLAGLPPETALHVQVTRPSGVTRKEPDDLVLRPGDNPALRVRFGQASLSGVVLGEDGNGLGGQELWLVAGEAVCGAKNVNRFLFHPSDEDNVSARTTSDASGRFDFPDVAPGVWWLGPAPKPRHRDRDRPTGPAPLATRITLAEAPRTARFTLKTSPPHFITGKVINASGAPGSSAVTAAQPGLGSCNGLHNGGGEGAWAGPGRFELGPLPSGAYTLHAGRHPGPGTPAKAGATDVVLKLEPTGSIGGRVEDRRTGQRLRPAAVGYWNGQRSGWITQLAGDDFEIADLKPGRHALWARTADGRVGVLEGVEVVADARRPPVVIPVEPGARLRLFYSGPDRYAHFDALYRGIPVASDGIHTGTSSVQHVPAGELTVRLRLENRPPEEMPIVVTAGEERDLFFRIHPR